MYSSLETKRRGKWVNKPMLHALSYAAGDTRWEQEQQARFLKDIGAENAVNWSQVCALHEEWAKRHGKSWGEVNR